MRGRPLPEAVAGRRDFRLSLLLCTAGSFVPQVVKAWREGDTRALSLRMYLALTAGFVLWLGYALLVGSWPVIAFNIANLALSAAILRLKLREGRRAGPGRATRARGGPDSERHRGGPRLNSRTTLAVAA